MIDWLKIKRGKKGPDEGKKEKVLTLSNTESLVLQLLLDKNRELFGLEMIEESEGRLKRGTIYVTLQRMEEKGLITSRQEARSGGEVGIPRRLYCPTGHGVRLYQGLEMLAMRLAGENI